MCLPEALRLSTCGPNLVPRNHGGDSKLDWYDSADPFITDSDPQYFCITIGRLEPTKTEPE